MRSAGRQRGGPIAPGRAELDGDVPAGRAVQALVGQRGSRRVATEALQAVPMPGRHADARVQVEALPARMPRARHRRSLRRARAGRRVGRSSVRRSSVPGWTFSRPDAPERVGHPPFATLREWPLCDIDRAARLPTPPFGQHTARLSQSRYLWARAKAADLRDQRCVRRHRRHEPLRHGVRRRLSHPPQSGRRDARTKN